MRSSFIKNVIKYLLTRNVRLQSKGLPSGMGQTRKGTVTKVKRKAGWHDPMTIPRADQVMGGGGRVFTPSGGGKSKFMTKGSTYGHTRGTKIAGTGVGGGALITAAAYTQEAKAPSGPATAGERQFTAVTALRGLRTNPTKVRPLPRKRSTEFMTRTVTQGGKVISAKPYKSTSGSSLGPYAKDISKMSKSGYHKFKAGSAGAKSFQAAHKAAKGKQFRWKGTGKLYSGA